MSFRESWRSMRGVARSLRIYYGDQRRRTAMDDFYRPFMRPGDLVFDVGAHVGDRVACFRRLGARVIAVEPQPALVRTLTWMYGRDRDVAIEAIAVASRAGTIELRLNLDNPTVSTASAALIEAARAAPAWQGQVWSKSIRVPATTLDDLIGRHGRPRFIKIDVEGYEAEALAGLTQPVEALSFEFTTIQRAVALACLEHCARLGYRRYNAMLGESLHYEHSGWRSAEVMKDWIAKLPDAANSGDLYALL
jgi:FkbM family methyltransferase